MSEDLMGTPIVSNDIAVIGMGCRLPGATSAEGYWQNLKNGFESITSLSDDELREAAVAEPDIANPDYVKSGMFLEDMECFDAGFFGFSPQDARILDPQHRHFIECAWEAFEDAGYIPGEIEGSVGVYAGSGHNAYLPFNLMTNPEMLKQVGFFLLRHTGNDKDFLATRASYLFNLLGPSINVQTACSTSLVGVHLAVQSLLSGECDMSLAGGVTINMPHRQGYLYKENEILSRDGHCRPFEAASDGTVFGSGAGCVLLKRLEDAVRDGDNIHAVIKSSAINNDGANKVSYLAPSVDGQSSAIRETIELAEIDPASVTFVECHGTGTAMGDPIEVAALTQAYGADNPKKQYCALGSVKSNIGHLDTAAGVAGLIKVVMSLKNKQIPATLHFNSPNPAIDFVNSPFYVNDRLRDWASDGARRAGVSSLGVGGTNAHVIVEEYNYADDNRRTQRPYQLLLVSGRSPEVVDRYSASHAQFMSVTPSSLENIAYTSAVGRKVFSHRRAVVGANHADMSTALTATKTTARVDHKAAVEHAPVAFMFAGGGSQYINMGRDLYEHEPFYKATLDECIRVAQGMLDFDLKALLFPSEADEVQAGLDMVKPSRALPVLFVTQYAQALLWQSWGVSADSYIGHSLGEYTAACLAGVFSLKDALSIVIKRAALFETMPEGAMLSVMLGQDEVIPYLELGLSLAAVNSQSLCVLSGPVDIIETAQAMLEEKEVEYRRVHISVAAHSHMLDSILDEFAKFLKTIDLKSPEKKVVSNLTGQWLAAEDAVDPKYWVRHLRETVRFAEGMTLLLSEELMPILLEVGPGNTLSSFARQHDLVGRDNTVASSMKHPKEAFHDCEFMLLSLGRVWCGGGDVDWEDYYAGHAQKVSIPTYPFEKQKHWVSPGSSIEAFPIGRQALDKWFYQPAWKPDFIASVENYVPTVIFGSESVPVIKAISKHLTGKASSLVTVSHGSRFEKLGSTAFQVDMSDIKQVDTLLTSLSQTNVKTMAMLYAWPLSQADDKAFEHFFRFAKGLIEHDISDLKLTILLERTLAANPGEDVKSPMAATISGAARVLAKELPSATIRLVDIDDASLESWSSVDAGKALAAEMMSAPATFEASCYRNGYRYIETFTASALSASRTFKPRPGVYLITGGLGGLALTVAEQLAANPGIKLALISYRDIPDQKDWQEHSLRNSRLGRRLKRLLSLAEQAQQLEVYTANVADVEQLTGVINRAREELGSVTGAFHAAGVIDDNLLSFKTLEECQAVLSPKIDGAQALVSALAPDSLDFLVLYSSVSSVTGMSGQFDYAAANAFLDSYAHQIRKAGVPAVSVNWSAWQHVGMAAELASGERMMGGQVPDFAPYQDGNHYRIYVDSERWWVNEHRTKTGLALVPGTGFIDSAYQAAKTLLVSTPDEMASKCIQLNDLFFSSPMLIHDGEQKVLNVSIDRKADDLLLVISSADSLDAADEQAWLGEHVEGMVRLVERQAIKTLDIEGIRQRCQQETIIRKGDSSHPHMDFGKRWACVNQVHVGGSEVLVELELTKSFESDLTETPLHPGLLDMATGAGHILASGYNPANDFFVPLSYGCVTVYGDFELKMYSHITWLADEADQSSFNIRVCSAVGKCLLDIERFVVKRMEAGALDDIDRAISTELDIDLSLGIIPSEGQEVLNRLLSVSACPQIIISPVSFDTVIHQVRQPETISQHLEGVERPTLDADYEAPKNSFEEKMVVLWSAALGIENIGVQDNFFELGGHSLLLTQLATKAKKEIGIALPLSRLFDSPTVRGWSEIVGVNSSADFDKAAEVRGRKVNHIEPIVRAGDKSTFQFPLSSTQSSLWFVHESSDNNSAYHIPLTMRYRGALNINALRDALTFLTKRHEVLRTNYGENEGEMIQVVSNVVQIDFQESRVEDLNLNEMLSRAARAPFNLRRGCVMRCHVFTIGAEDNVVMFNVHHIAVDHTSLMQLMRELEAAYSDLCQGRTPQLEEPRLHYVDYVSWLRLQDTDHGQKIEVWKRRLKGFSGALDLPLDRSRPAIASGAGAQFLFDLDVTTSKNAVRFSSENAVSLYITLLSNFCILLNRYSKQDDIIVGTPFTNRANEDELDDVIGCFINMLPLATNLEICTNFEDVIAEVKAVMFEAYDNQGVPLNVIVDAVHPVRDLSYNPLFQVGFIFQEPPAGLELAGLESELLPVHSGGAMYDIHVWVWQNEENDSLSGLIWYNTDIFSESTIARFSEHFSSLLGVLTDNPKSDFRASAILTSSEQSLYREMNQTERSLPSGATLHSLIAKTASSRGNKVAVVGEDGQLTYAELDNRSSQLATYLITQGVEKGSSVGVSMERRSDMLVALLGVLKSGACYIPMDPTYPKERLAYMAEQAGIRLVICCDSVKADIDYFEHELLSIDGQWSSITTSIPTSCPLPEIDPENIAYVIFTSGSTGLPKGVQVPHRAVVNFLLSMAEKPGLQADDRLLAITTLSFDIAVLELYLPLVVGAQTIIASDNAVMDGDELKDLIDEHEITVMQATPSTWRSLIAAGWKGGAIKSLCGGEPFPVDLAKTLTGLCAEVWNMYGPTETAVWSTCRLVNPDRPNVIGRPIGNTQCFILNEQGQQQPIGVEGELYIGGQGVTHGYLNRPELTEAAFVKVPALGNGLYYKTGDSVRFIESGELEYVQRIDNQVKVRGYRIELGEIESVILKHDAVAECAVAVKEYTAIDKRIVAYIRFTGNEHLTMTDLRRHLRGYLPDYMIPQMLVELDALPLTPNGKVDRKALPDPYQDLTEEHEILEPSTPVEKVLSEIWKEAIGVEQVSLDSYFFDIGGHSMLSMQVIYKISDKFGVRLKPADLVLNTLEQIAAMLPQGGDVDSGLGSQQKLMDSQLGQSSTGSNKQPDGFGRTVKGFFKRLLGENK